MKTQLTKEQSEHLIDLGIPEVYASVLIQPKHIGGQVVMPDRRFSFTDILDILPKEIFDEDLYSRNYFVLESTNTGLWHVGYAHEVSYEGYFFLIERFDDELIDALYELCVWCLKNNHLKFNKDDKAD